MNDIQVGYPEELSIFEKPAKNVGIKQARCITYYPVNDFSTQGVIQFRIPNNSTSYVDLSKTRLNISCKILRKDGKSMVPYQIKKSVSDDKATNSNDTSTTGDKADASANTATAANKATSAAVDEDDDYDICLAANNAMHSLFSRVDVSLQDKILTNADDCYPYEAYIKTLLMTTKEEKQSLESQGFFDDTGYHIFNSNWVLKPEDNPLYKRGKLLENSKEADFSGPICSSVMDIQKLLPYGLTLGITLHPSKDSFCLLSSVEDKEYHMVITKATLSVCMIEVAPEVAIAHSQIMENTPAIFPYKKTEVKKFTLATGIYSASINDPFQGRIPEQIIIGIVRDSAQNGSFLENPFYFENASLNFLGVTIDGQPMGIDPIQPKYGLYDEEGNYIVAHQTLNGVGGNEKINPIGRLDYPNGRTLYRFQEEFEGPLKRTGNMSISFRFDYALKKGMCVIVYARFPGGLKVDKSRAVYDF